jgi:hypothetical protein
MKYIKDNRKPGSLLFIIANNKLTKEQNEKYTSTFENDKQLYSDIEVVKTFECVGISYDNNAIDKLTVSICY